MAKKTFKSLPKKAQRAAFAEMDDSGTRRNMTAKVEVKTVKKTDAPYRFDPKIGTVSHLTDIRARKTPRTEAQTATIKTNLAKLAKSPDATPGMKALNSAVKRNKK